jgi:hypothetical protein
MGKHAKDITEHVLSKQKEKYNEASREHFEAMNKRDKARSSKQIERTSHEIKDAYGRVKHYEKLIEMNENTLNKLRMGSPGYQY